MGQTLYAPERKRLKQEAVEEDLGGFLADRSHGDYC
jgi:hypothetical protein